MASHSSEAWLPVVGYEGVYEVSDHGRVRRVAGGQGATPGIRKPSTHPNGYQLVTLSMNNVQATKPIHRLVLEAFIGPCPEGMEGCHNDDDPLNNHVSNLRWDTHRSNCEDRSANGKPVKPSPLRSHCRNGHEFPDGARVDGRGHRICESCREERNARARKYPNAKTECRRGHSLSDENVYISPKGRRGCRACRKLAEGRRDVSKRRARDRARYAATRGHKHGGKNL